MRISGVADYAAKVIPQTPPKSHLTQLSRNLWNAVCSELRSHFFQKRLLFGVRVELVGMEANGDGVVAGEGDGFAVEGDGALEVEGAGVAVGTDGVGDGDYREGDHDEMCRCRCRCRCRWCGVSGNCVVVV